MSDMSKNELVAKTNAKQAPPHMKDIRLQTFVYRVGDWTRDLTLEASLNGELTSRRIVVL